MKASNANRIDLRDFVNDNESLLTAFGVFAGLSAGFTILQNEAIAGISFAIASLLLFEIIRYPSKEERHVVSLSCLAFKVGIIAIMIALSSYVVEASLTFALSHLNLVASGVIFVPLYVLARFILDLLENKTGLSMRIGSSRPTQIAITFLVGLFLMVIYAISEFLVSLVGL